jgi:hypothetical protein
MRTWLATVSGAVVLILAVGAAFAADMFKAMMGA